MVLTVTVRLVGVKEQVSQIESNGVIVWVPDRDAKKNEVARIICIDE